MDLAALTTKFRAHFADSPEGYAAPGRVNLIGEHTDYNDGFVFPMALNFYTYVAVAARRDRHLHVYSENMQEAVWLSLDDLSGRRHHWSDYVAGIADELEKTGIHLPGADLYISSEVPVGAGLSSSAAIEMAVALALSGLAHAILSPLELAKLGQRAENHFVGMNCGIMDQFIAMHGEKDHALLLDCRSLAFQHVTLPSENIRIVVCNSMVKHELGSSAYNRRRAECEEGVRLMQARFPGITHLRDVSPAQFLQVQDQLTPVVRARCRHVISENQRVLDSLTSLQSNDLARFGRLMNASHDSLRDDYQVSCRELDVLVDLARSSSGCLGSRMTGGGFGGCTVNLVALDHVDAFVDHISSAYHLRTGLSPQVYITMASQGAHKLTS